MVTLKKDWITDGLIDFEYKKYVLLAYLKQVEAHFDSTRLYPSLSDLIDHYKDALHLKTSNEEVVNAIPKTIDRFDLNKLRIIYKKLEDEDLLSEIQLLINYALPAMERAIKKGKEIYEETEAQMSIEPIGIIPLYRDEGYVLMEHHSSRFTRVYQYHIKKFILLNEQMRGIYFKWVEGIKRGIGDSFERIKLRLIREQKDLPNPATFLIQTHQTLPLEETFIPLGKRMVLRSVNSMRV